MKPDTRFDFWSFVHDVAGAMEFNATEAKCWGVVLMASKMRRRALDGMASAIQWPDAAAWSDDVANDSDDEGEMAA